MALFASVVMPPPIATYPGATVALRSPDHQAVVTNVDVASDDEMQHGIFVESPKQRRALVFAYGRAADVIWSDDSQHLIVNDRFASDLTTSYVVLARPPYTRWNLRECLEKSPRFGPTFLDLHHNYVRGLRMFSDGRVIVQLTGHGGGNFNRPFAVDQCFELDPFTCAAARVPARECSRRMRAQSR